MINSEKTFVIPENNYVLAMVKADSQKGWRRFFCHGKETLCYAIEQTTGMVKFSIAENGVVCDIGHVRSREEAERVYEQFCKLAEVNDGSGRTSKTN